MEGPSKKVYNFICVPVLFHLAASNSTGQSMGLSNSTGQPTLPAQHNNCCASINCCIYTTNSKSL